jgi:diadenosine tetraphosphatase ApaH/serine/threonine PP2A family protein phosphatase
MKIEIPGYFPGKTGCGKSHKYVVYADSVNSELGKRGCQNSKNRFAPVVEKQSGVFPSPIGQFKVAVIVGAAKIIFGIKNDENENNKD